MRIDGSDNWGVTTLDSGLTRGGEGSLGIWTRVGQPSTVQGLFSTPISGLSSRSVVMASPIFAGQLVSDSMHTGNWKVPYYDIDPDSSITNIESAFPGYPPPWTDSRDTLIGADQTGYFNIWHSRSHIYVGSQNGSNIGDNNFITFMVWL